MARRAHGWQVIREAVERKIDGAVGARGRRRIGGRQQADIARALIATGRTWFSTVRQTADSAK